MYNRHTLNSLRSLQSEYYCALLYATNMLKRVRQIIVHNGLPVQQSHQYGNRASGGDTQ